MTAHHGGLREYNILIDRYKKETLHEEKNRIGYALAEFRDGEILKRTVKFSISKHIRPQDTVSILSGVGLNPEGRDIWINFVKKNWKMLVSKYGEGGHTLSRLIKAISNSPEEKHFVSFKKFFASHDAPGAERSVEQVLERLESNIAWHTRDSKAVEKFLKN